MGVGLPTSRDIYLSWILFCVRRAVMAGITRILCCRRAREGPPSPKTTPLPWSKVRIAHTRGETVTDVSS